MAFERADFWAVELWARFAPLVQTADEFYLAADSNLIREIFEATYGSDQAPEQCLADFHEACLELLDVKQEFASVREAAFRPAKGISQSRAICLAVQQVLVVELMLNDDEHSEHSYFPRYRNVLQIDSLRQNLCPIPTAQFHKIWRTLESEIFAIAGSSKKSVTFSFGAGRDINRALPLSQALLSSHDLTVFREKMPKIGVNSTDAEILRGLYLLRNHFGNRANSIVNEASEVRKLQLCNQVRSFVQNFGKLSILHTRARRVYRRDGLIAFLDAEDFFEEKISFYLRLDGTQIEGTALEAAIRKRLEKAPIFLVSRGDAFVEVNNSNPVSNGDGFICVTDRYGDESRLTTFIKEVGQNYFEEKSSNLSRRFRISYRGSVLASEVAEFSGHQGDAIDALELDGGLLADGRSRIYLFGYAPTAIIFNAERVSEAETIICNGKKLLVKDFLNSLESDASFSNYRVEHSGVVLEFAIGRENSNSERSRYGYRIVANELAPICSPIGSHDVGLQGVQLRLPTGRSVTKVSSRDLAILLSKGPRLSLTAEAVSTVVEALDSVSRSSIAIELIKRLLIESRSLPTKALHLPWIAELINGESQI